MKKIPFSPFFALVLMLTSCEPYIPPSDEVVCETVHRYRVPLDPDEWSLRGQNGQVVSMRKDGVNVTRSYERGILHGECSYTFPNRDVIQKKELYHQGTMTQETFHYPDGMPQKQIAYQSPQRKSTVIWYETGAPQAQEEMMNGKLVRGEYYHENQQIESRVDDSNGYRVNRDGQGNLEAVDTIQNGEMTLSTAYHPDGTPAAITPYVNGVIEGERHTYHPEGEPATIETWTKNVQHGTTIVYEQGEKRAEVPYVNGVKQGVERRFRGSGQAVAQEVTWEKGEQHGPTYSYIGDSSRTDWYFRGRKVPNRATFDMMCAQ